jgi:hypothetical protein
MMASNPTSLQYDVLEDASRLALEYLRNIDARPVSAQTPEDTLQRLLGGSLPEDGETPDQVVRALADGVRGGLMTSAGGRFFGSEAERSRSRSRPTG